MNLNDLNARPKPLPPITPPSRTPTRTPSRTPPHSKSPTATPKKQQIPTKSPLSRTPPKKSMFDKTSISTDTSGTQSNCLKTDAPGGTTTTTTTTTSNTVTPVSSFEGQSAITVTNEVTPPGGSFENYQDSSRRICCIRSFTYVFFILTFFVFVLWTLTALTSLHYLEFGFIEEKFLENG